MKEEMQVKGVLGLAAGVFTFLAGSITELVVVLALLMILDYVTGIVALMFQGEKFDPKKGAKGAAKKLGYIIMLVVAFLGDYVIFYFTDHIGYTLPFTGLLGLALTLYFIGNEGFSVIQNLGLIGVPYPEFISKFFGLMKDEAGKLVKMEPGGSNE